MKTRGILAVLAIGMVCAWAGPVRAVTLDICVNGAKDAHFDSTGIFFVAAAPLYREGTIAQSATPIDCTKVTATPIGTFFVNGGFVVGLGGANKKDAAFVTWHFRFDNVAFDTIGPVRNVGPGGTYPQTIVGSSPGSEVPANGVATVTSLDPTGFVFQIETPDTGDE